MILLTGSSGFLGKYVLNSLSRADGRNKILTLGRNPSNDILCDLALGIPVITESITHVVHAAGKAHFQPKTEEEKKSFFSINSQGTRHLLSALNEQSELSHLVYISSVAVYGRDSGSLLDEETPLRGNSPYALSKIEAEKLISDWCASRGVAFLILRLPLLCGQNPPGNLGDLIQMIHRRRYFRIGKSKARKSILYAGDVATFIRNWLNQINPVSGIFNLTDGNDPYLYQIENKIGSDVGVNFIPSMPIFLLKIGAYIGDYWTKFPLNHQKLQKLTHDLTFSDQKARKLLLWSPSNAFDHPWT